MSLRTVTLTIERLTYGPAGIGRADGKVVFVPGTVPGDTVEVALDEEKKTYATGHVVTLRNPSPQRRHPPCPYVPHCGGCPWQHVAYAEQLHAKEALVREQMRRIGGIAEPPVLPIISSPQEWHYRHRVRLHAEKNARLGFSQARSHDLVEIESCLIAKENVAAHFQTARTWLTSLHTAVRWVELITADPSCGIILIGNAESAFYPADDAVCTRFLSASPLISGLVLFGRGWRRGWGSPLVSLDLGIDGLTLELSPGVFTQVNPAGNRVLITALLEIGDFQKGQQVVELYCGAGNFSVPLACQVRALIGIERDQQAIADARANAARIGLRNARFMCAPVQRGVEELLSDGVQSDVIVLDPPRAGAAEVIDQVPRLGAQRVVYVSCDPATLARDLRQLSRHGYQVRVLQPLDLFPHTYHVETIALSVLTC